LEYVSNQYDRSCQRTYGNLTPYELNDVHCDTDTLCSQREPKYTRTRDTETSHHP